MITKRNVAAIFVVAALALGFAIPHAIGAEPDERDIRFRAATDAVTQQCDVIHAQSRAIIANLAGDNAALSARVKALQAELAKLKPKE